MKKICIALMILMLLSASAFAAEGALNSFSTFNMKGEPVTQAIFADYDLTMVNVWTTYCKICVYEMPELERLRTMLPENVNLITICNDASVSPVKAYQILEYTGANFETLFGTREIYDQFLYQVVATPTTFFLDSEGMPVGEEIIGIPSTEDVAETYLGVIHEILNS